MTGKHRRIDLKILVISAVLLITASALAGGVYARYRTEQIKETEMAAERFHISSDYLDVRDRAKSYTLPEWAGGITLELYNFEKENESLVSDSAITYKIQVTGFTTAVTDGATAVSPDGDGNYTMPANGQTTHKIKLTPKSIPALSGKTVTVKIIVTAPFEKELTADFILEDNTSYTYEVIPVTDNGNYYELVIYTDQYSGPLTVTWPQDLIPDNTSPIMRTWTGRSGSYSDFAKLSTYRLIFFNPKGSAYTESDFSVTATE